MTFIEIESIMATEEPSNDYTQGYDDGIKGKPAKLNASQQYNNGYGYAYELGEKQSVGNN